VNWLKSEIYFTIREKLSRNVDFKIDFHIENYPLLCNTNKSPESPLTDERNRVAPVRDDVSALVFRRLGDAQGDQLFVCGLLITHHDENEDQISDTMRDDQSRSKAASATTIIRNYCDCIGADVGSLITLDLCDHSKDRSNVTVLSISL
jgi:hypothetical protein